MNLWEEDDRRRNQARQQDILREKEKHESYDMIFMLLVGVWKVLFQVGVLFLLSIIAWKIR